MLYILPCSMSYLFRSFSPIIVRQLLWWFDISKKFLRNFQETSQKCPKMFKNVQKCSKMFKNVSECFEWGRHQAFHFLFDRSNSTNWTIEKVMSEDEWRKWRRTANDKRVVRQRMAHCAQVISNPITHHARYVHFKIKHSLQLSQRWNKWRAKLKHAHIAYCPYYGIQNLNTALCCVRTLCLFLFLFFVHTFTYLVLHDAADCPS